MRFYLFFACIAISLSFSVVPGFVDDLSKHLKIYYKGRPEQQLYFTFHQSKYIAGDTAFFKGYLFRKANYTLASGKHIVNLRLLDKNNTVILSERILFDNGFGQGYIILHTDVEEGYHTLSAYSDEMLANADTLSFLSKPFCIAGKERSILGAAIEPKISFEGGRLVEGVQNRAVLQATPSTLIKIADDLNAVDTSFISDASGWTRFNFTPGHNAVYFITTESKKVQFPKVETDGVSITLDRDTAHEYYSVKTKAFKNSSYLKTLVHAIVTSGEDIVFSRSFELSELNSFFIPFPLTSPGLNRLTVFSDEGKVLGERLFYVTAEKATLTTQLSEDIVNTRGSVQLGLQLNTINRQPVNGRVSISITKDEYFFADSMSKIPDLHRELIAQSVAIEKSGILTDWEQSERGFDQYLILHYRETIPWEKVLSGIFPAYKSISPYYIKGRAVFRESNQPLPDSSFITFYLNGYENVFGRHTKNGNFIFPMYMNFGDDEVFYRAEFKGKTLEGIKIIVDDPTDFGTLRSQLQVKRTKEPDAYFKFGAIKQAAEKSFNFYGSVDKVALIEKREVQGDWKADFYVDLKKLKIFPSISEIFHEVVPMVQVRRKNEQNIVRVFLKPRAIYASDNPVYIIDGVMTDNTDYFLSLSPEKIAMIKVIRSNDNLLHFGVLGKNGVIIIQSKTGEYRENTSTSDNSIHVKGLQQPNSFSFPDYSDRSERKPYRNAPDLRAVLYWNPDVTIKNSKADIKFSTSDLTGRFTVKIEGLTESGDLVEGTESFKVTFTKP
jgi:hypothetical protein